MPLPRAVDGGILQFVQGSHVQKISNPSREKEDAEQADVRALGGKSIDIAEIRVSFKERVTHHAAGAHHVSAVCFT